MEDAPTSAPHGAGTAGEEALPDDDPVANGEGGWLLPALVPELFEEEPTVRLQGFVRVGGLWTFDEPFGSTDEIGVELENLRLAALGETEHTRFFLETELRDGELELFDGWGELELDASHRVRAGRFREPLLRSGLIPPATTIFPDRTLLGETRNRRDAGAQLEALYGPVTLTGALQNGDDGTAQELRTTVRAEWAAVGGGVAYDESVIRTVRGHQLSVGVAVQDEAALEEGETFALDAAWRYDGYGAHVEWLENADGYPASNPWSATVMAQVLENEADFALRYQAADDALSQRVVSAAYNHYVAAGFMRFWGAVDWLRADGSSEDGWRVRVGAQFTF